MRYSFQYELVKTNGDEYMSITKDEIILKSQRTYYNLENLFNGNKQLSKSESLNEKNAPYFCPHLLVIIRCVLLLLTSRVFQEIGTVFLFFLGDDTNRLLNENTQEVSQELNKPVSETIRKIVREILNNYTKAVPFPEIFV